jgi:transaldolase
VDGPTNGEINHYNNVEIVHGYTFNPTLFRQLKVANYFEHCKELVGLCGDLSISLEVIADDKEGMVRQAKKLSSLGDTVSVKIPVTFTSGESTKEVIKILSKEGIKLNITAVFSKDQVQEFLSVMSETNSIISVFSGRLFDIGKNAVEVTGKIADFVHNNSKCRVLWASPRMVYDLLGACEAKCDIITMQSSLMEKIPLMGRSSREYSLDTVKMFYNDAVASKYTL